MVTKALTQVAYLRRISCGRVLLWGVMLTVCVTAGGACHGEQKPLWRLNDGPANPTTAAVGAGFLAYGHATGVSLVAQNGAPVCNVEGIGPVVAQPRVEGSRVFVVSTNHLVYALDAKCHTLWRRVTESPLVAPAELAGANLIVGTEQGHVMALDAATGVPRWVYPSPQLVLGDKPALALVAPSADAEAPAEPSPAAREGEGAATAMSAFPVGAMAPASFAGAKLVVTDGLVYAGNEDHFLYVLDANTGKLSWAYEATAAVVGGPVVSPEAVYLVSDDGMLHAVGRENHALSWKTSLGNAPCHGLALATATVVAACLDGRLYVVDRTAGTIKWQRQLDAPAINDPVVQGNVLWLAGGVGRDDVVALPMGPGDPLWHFAPTPAASGSSGVASVTILTDMVVVGTPKGDVHAVALPNFAAMTTH